MAEAYSRLAYMRTDELALRELAASQGTTTNAIYTLFGGKDQLIDRVIDSAVVRLVEIQTKAIGDTPTMASLQDLGRAYRKWALEHPELYRILFVYRSMCPIERGPDRCGYVIQPLKRLLNDLAERGAIVAENVDAIALTLRATLHGWIMFELNHVHDFGAGDADSRFEHHMSYFLQGIMPQQLVTPGSYA